MREFENAVEVNGGRLVCDPATKRLEFWPDCLPHATEPALVLNQSAFAGYEHTVDGVKAALIEHTTFMALMPHIASVKAGVFNLCHPEEAGATQALNALKDLSPHMAERAAMLATLTQAQVKGGDHSEN